MKRSDHQREESSRFEKLKARLERSHLDYTVKQSGGSTVVQVRRKAAGNEGKKGSGAGNCREGK